MKYWGHKRSRVLLLPFILSVLVLCGVNIFLVEDAVAGEKSPAPELTASLDRKSARVGDMVCLALRYRLPASARLHEKTEIKGIEGVTIIDRVKKMGCIKIRFLVDRLGEWKIGPISLTYVDKNGEEGTMNAGAISLKVLSNLGEKPEEARLRPIQDIIPVEPIWLKYMPWAVALAGILFIIGALTWWYRKRRSRDLLPEVIDPPHIKARKEIDRLEAQGLFEKGKVKAFYFTLSEILRRYMESVRHFPAAEYTTEEIAHHIRNNEEDRKILNLFRQADLVKFADTVPTPTRKDEDIKMARSYIQETSLVLETVHRNLKDREDAR